MTLPGFAGPSVRVKVCGVSDPGVQRSQNQDSFVMADLSEGKDITAPRPRKSESSMESRQVELGSLGLLLMVADGMGGAAGGKVASRMATSHVLASIAENWIPERGPSPERFISCLREAVRASNTLIYEQSNRHPAYEGMGTTATVAGVLEDYLYLAQIGDSRAYLVREGLCTQLTWDQSFENYAIESGWMSPQEVQQSQHKNTILQALGPAPSVEVDLTFQHLRRGDLLVLCSDGLFRVVSEPEIASCASHDVESACTALIEMAIARGAPDNVTVLLARFEGEGLQMPETGDAVGRQPVPEAGE